MKKIIVAVLAAFAIIAGLATPVTAANGDAYNIPSDSLDNKSATRFFIAEDNATQSYSEHTARGTNSAGETGFWWCDSYSSVDCNPFKSNGKYEVNGFNILPACTAEKLNDCVAGVSITTPDGVNHPGNFVRQIEGLKFPADPHLGLTEGSTVSLWDIPGAPNAGGNTSYAVNTRIKFSFNATLGRYVTESMVATVAPYRLVEGDRYQSLLAFSIPAAQDLHGHAGAGISGVAHDCVWNERGKCGILQEFSPGDRAKLSLHITNQIGGWFKGRLASPIISVQKYSDTNNEIVVEAEPVSVPRMEAIVTKENAPANVVDLYQHSGLYGALWSGESAFTTSAGGMAFEYLDAFRAAANDTAVGSTSMWSFATVESTTQVDCLADKSRVLGFVTTNSMVYDGGIPIFENGTLNYRVAGMHYLPGGSDPVQGSYDLVMRSDAARCLYHFTSAPLQASVSIFTEGGTEKVAVSTMNEHDGWLTLSSKGFTYSSPTIRVKLTQAAAEQSSTQVSKPVQVLTLTCTKGKAKKIVKGAHPVCPRGYKAK